MAGRGGEEGGKQLKGRLKIGQEPYQSALSLQANGCLTPGFSKNDRNLSMCVVGE